MNTILIPRFFFISTFIHVHISSNSTISFMLSLRNSLFRKSIFMYTIKFKIMVQEDLSNRKVFDKKISLTQ